MDQQYWEQTKIKTNGIYWYKNKENTAAVSPQQKAMYHCLNSVQDGQYTIHKTDGKYKLWGVATEPEIKAMISDNNYIYEVLPAVGKRKVYFDIDCPVNKAKENHLDCCKKVVLEMFPNASFQISGSVTDTKISYHMILSNYYADCVKDTMNLKAFCSFFEDYGFDPCVYTKNRNMKCINQMKGWKTTLQIVDGKSKKTNIKDTRIQSYIEGSKSLTKHLINCDFDPDAINIKTLDFKDYCLVLRDQGKSNPNVLRKRLKFKKKAIDILSIKAAKQVLSPEFDFFNATDIQKLKVLPNENLHHDICWHVMHWCKHRGISFEDFWEWNKKKDSSELRKEKYIDYWGKQNYNVRREYVDKLLELYYPQLKSNYLFYRYADYVDNSKVATKVLKRGKYTSYKHISHSKKATILGVGTGCGKTEAAGQYVKHNSKSKVLVMVPRITLSYDIQTRFNNILEDDSVKFKNYKSLELIQMQKCDRLIISPPSLHKLERSEIKYDTLIIDEFETLIDMFLSPKINSNGYTLEKNWEIFIRLLMETPKIILMDAITTKKTLKFLKMLEIDYELITNKKSSILTLERLKREIKINEKGKEYPEEEIETERRFFNIIMNSIKKKEKSFVYMPYKEGRKNEPQCIRGVLPLMNYITKNTTLEKGKDIEGYYAEAYEEKKKLKEVNKTWEEFQVIITNNCNSVGINYELPDVDRIYLYIASWCNPRDVLQVLRRIRHVKNKEVVFYYEPARGNSMYQEQYQKVEKYIDEYEFLKKCNILEKSSSSKETFYHICKLNGVDYNSKEISEEQLKGLEELIKFEKDDDYRITYEKIPDIDAHEVGKLNAKYEGGMITLAEKYMLEKNKFKENHFCNDEELMSELWIYRDYIYKIDDLYKSEGSQFKEFLEWNGIDIFSNKFKEFPIDGRVPLKFNIKSLDFLDEFKYKRGIKSFEQGTYIKIINAYFSHVIKYEKGFKTIKNKQYNKIKTNENFILCLDFYRSYNRRYNKRPYFPEILVLSDDE